MNVKFPLAAAAAPLVVFALLGAGEAANAQDAYYAANANINSRVNGDVYVGYANASDLASKTNPASPAVGLITGGFVTGGLFAYNASAVTLPGGALPGGIISYSGVSAHNNSAVNINGGFINGASGAYDNSAISVGGGFINGGLVANDNSTVNIFGGSINGGLAAFNSGTINFFGVGLATTLLDPNYNSGASSVYVYSQYVISGTLRDGSFLPRTNLLIQNGTGARFVLHSTAAVPEPGAMALLAGMATLSAGILRRRCRK